MTNEEIQKHIEQNCRNAHGEPMMDEQAFYEGAKWMRDKALSLSDVVEQRNMIEKLQSELKALNENYRREQDKVKELHSQLRFTHLESIADIKSVQKMLSIYENEAMTHREKAYLGRKLNQVIQNMVDEKIKDLDSAFSLDGDLPF